MQKAGYRVIVKIFLTIFMTIGCNLMMGEPWREDIFPYVFLILAGAALFSMDDEKLSVWARENKRKALLLLAASFLIQCALRRPDQAESLMVFIKICVKMLICSITLFVILSLCMIRLLKERKLPGKIFCLFSMITVLYFYFIRGGKNPVYIRSFWFCFCILLRERIKRGKERKKLSWLAHFFSHAVRRWDIWRYSAGGFMEIFCSGYAWRRPVL